ncbi:MAG: type II CAAX endopeptidase family protein [Pseudomonadota bacterium]
MPGLWLGVWASVIYIGFLALTTALIFGSVNTPAALETVLWQLLAVQCIAALFCALVAWRRFGWVGAGFYRLDPRALFLMAPAIAVLGIMYWDISAALSWAEIFELGPMILISLVILTACVGFGEEVLFRGILLRSALRRLHVAHAMLLSAVLFGVFHLINVLAGQSVGTTGQQVIFAFLVGFAMAPVALRLRNLWPLIIWHWLWNLAVFVSQAFDILHPLVLSGMAMQAVISVWLWVDLARFGVPAPAD